MTDRPGNIDKIRRWIFVASGTCVVAIFYGFCAMGLAQFFGIASPTIYRIIGVTVALGTSMYFVPVLRKYIDI